MVQDMEGKKSNVVVTKDTTVKQLRSKLKQYHHEFRDCTRLLYRGKNLTNQQATVEMLNIQKGFAFQYVTSEDCTADCCKGTFLTIMFLDFHIFHKKLNDRTAAT